MLRKILLIAILGTASTVPALAHHGISNWDLNKDLSITGTLVRMDLINPHSWIFVDVKGTDGKLVHWRCEMRSVNSLRRSGWTTDMFKIGSTISITGSPERHKPAYCYLGTIVFADGSRMDRYGQRQLSASSASKQAAQPHVMRTATGLPNLAGDWAAEQRVMSDPRGQSGTLVPLSDAAKMKPGDLPAGQKAFPGARGSPESLAADPVRAAWDRPVPVKLTEAGQKASRAFNPASRENPRLRCEPTSILFDWTFDSVVNRVTQTPTRITMQYGHMDLARVIHLDATVPAGVKPSRAGYSIGHWDADTLVVETSAFLPGVLNADGRLLHGARLHVTERFRVEPGPVRLTRQFVAEDPEYWTEPWRGTDVVFPADVSYAPYRCKDPGGAPAG